MSASSVRSAGVATGSGAGRQAPAGEVVVVPIVSLRAGESPRLNGEDQTHVARLAGAEGPLPPILVQRRTMQVIDGMHRLLAASLTGRETVDVVFFDGRPADVFLLAVEANVTHGLPLSHSDRRAAAKRIIASHPQMSDRAIGRSAGLAAKTVAAIRRSTGAVPQLTSRVGRDGRVRPLNGARGRLQAAQLLAEHPGASLREVARRAGVSPATARDVRQRLERGEKPTPARPGLARASSAASRREPTGVTPAAPDAAVQKLLRDPSLRHSEQGRQLLRMLQVNSAVGAPDWSGMVVAVPPHCTAIIGQIARHYAQMWQRIAQELDRRAMIIDPQGSLLADGRD
jgi:ParB-like chromosome segregation protein Spo0J